MYRIPKLLRVLPALFLPLLVLLQVNCNSSGTLPVGPGDGVFTINGLIIKDAVLNRTTVAARVMRDSAYDSTLVVVFGGDTLDFDAPSFLIDSVYSLTVGSATYYGPGSHTLEISSDGRTIRLPIMLPDTFSIDTVSPPTPPGLTKPDVVNLDWTATPNAAGYAMAAVKSTRTYIGDGYSIYADFAGTEGTIPQDAFYVDTNVATPQLDTGLWYLSVYGFNGAPDSTIGEFYLPVPLPSQLSNNIDTLNVLGSFGTISVTPFEILQVSSQ